VDVFTFNDANGGEGTYKTSVTNEIPRDRLQAQTINEVAAKNGDTYRLVSNEKFNYQTRDDGQDQDTKRGWYLDLDMPPGQGELVASNAQLKGDTVAFSTTIPNTQMCSASGSGYFMLLDRNTGGRTNFPAFDLNGDSQLNVNDTFARTENGESVAVGASGLLIDQGIPGQASHQLDPANDRAFFIVPASDGTTRQVYTNNKPDRRRSWREIRR
jgi:type IV pilus assembly protein PilY1